MNIKDLLIPITNQIILYSSLEVDGFWTIYLKNLSSNRLKDIFILSSSDGYIGGKRKKSSLLRHYYDFVNPNEVILVEPLIETSQLINFFDVSFYIDQLYENTYVFDINKLGSIYKDIDNSKSTHLLSVKYT